MKVSRLGKLAWWAAAAVIAALLAAVQMAAAAPADALTKSETVSKPPSGQTASNATNTAIARKKRPAQRPQHFHLQVGGAEAAGFFKEATGFDSESEVTEVR